jgi:RNA polymerase sigma-70 factor (ECF subfamily)
MASDEALIAAVAGGDGGALGELCRRWERPLFQFIHRHTGGRDVEDLYQETWLRVVRAARRFDPERRFSTWLFQIALNLCRDWHRRSPPEPADLEDVEALATPRLRSTPPRRAPPRRASRGAAERRHPALLSRPRRGRDGGHPDCPRGTVKSRLHHAMRRLVELARR